MQLIKNKYIIAVLTMMLIFLGCFLINTAEAAYVSNTLKARYVYDLEKGETFNSKLIYKLDYEKTLNTKNIMGKIITNPIFEYNLENKTEDIKLEEAYVDIYFDNFDLRMGKQKMTWGKSDGLVVTNIVNPRDYNVHPVISYEDQFQSVDAIKANFYPNNNTLEIVWIPEFKSAKFNREVLLKNLPRDFARDSSEKEVEEKFENSELFLRYSSLGQKYDYEVMAGYSWDDQPTFHKNFQRKSVIPQHHRLYTFGGSISTMRGPMVLRGEATYISGKHFNLINPLKHLKDYPEGVVEEDEIKWLLGLDYNYEDYLFSFQFMQEKILDYEKDLIQDEDQNTITFLIKRDFFRTRLNTEINFHYNVNEEVLMTIPSVSYDYNNSINFKLGANLNLEGETFRTDVIYLQTEYLF
jgi:hypothetical protein